MTEEHQLVIFDAGEGVELPVDPVGVSTGERLRSSRPRVYQLVVNGLAEGMGIVSLARATGVHHRTIAAIRDGLDHSGAIDSAKEETKRNLSQFIRLGSERLVEDYDKIPIASLAINLGIAIDKLQLYDGAPTSIIETRARPTHDDLNAYIAKLSAAQPVETGESGDQRERLGDGRTDSASVVLPGAVEGEAAE